MNYLKCIVWNFLTVFFSDYIFPGIMVMSQTKLPHVGWDIMFAALLGFMNSLIFPFLKVADQRMDVKRIAIASCSISFGAYLILVFAPIGIEIKSVEGYFLASVSVALVSFLTNFFEMKRSNQFPKPPDMPRMS